jgi:hypothetical protein
MIRNFSFLGVYHSIIDPAKIRKATKSHKRKVLERCSAVIAPRGDKIEATIKIGRAVL